MSRSQPYDFSDRIAWVTGAGFGMGAAAAKTFARHGAMVAALDTDTDRLVTSSCLRD